MNEPSDAWLEAIDWADETRRLVIYVRHLRPGWSFDRAEDIAQEAIKNFFGWIRKKRHRLDPHQVRRALKTSAVNALKNHGRKGDSRAIPTEPEKVVAMGEGEEVREHGRATTLETLEERVVRDERARRFIDMMLDRLGPDPLGTKVFLLFAEDVCDAPAQAKKLDRPIEDIYKARRRVQQHRLEVEQMLDREGA